MICLLFEVVTRKWHSKVLISNTYEFSEGKNELEVRYMTRSNCPCEQLDLVIN